MLYYSLTFLLYVSFLTNSTLHTPHTKLISSHCSNSITRQTQRESREGKRSCCKPGATRSSRKDQEGHGREREGGREGRRR